MIPVRIANTRVSLQSVIVAFHQGATAEEIVRRYPTLKLDDVEAVLSDYLRHRTEIDQYLQALERESFELQREIEARFNPQGFRDHLLARKAQRE